MFKFIFISVLILLEIRNSIGKKSQTQRNVVLLLGKIYSFFNKLFYLQKKSIILSLLECLHEEFLNLCIEYQQSLRIC